MNENEDGDPVNYLYDEIDIENGSDTKKHRAASIAANPTPLGTFAFGMTLLWFSMVATTGVSAETTSIISAYALFLGGLLQLLAGAWDFKRNHVFGATMYSIYGSLWLGYAIWQYLAKGGILDQREDFHAGLALFYLTWFLMSLIFLMGTRYINRAFQMFFFLLSLCFLLLAIGEYSNGIRIAGGLAGVLASLCALYIGFAELTNEQWDNETIPLWPIYVANSHRLVKDVPAANPTPLGTFAFGMTTLWLSFANASIVESETVSLVSAYALFLGGLLQLLAGMWDFVRKAAFGATVFSSYGAFWMGFALWQYLTRAELLEPGEEFRDGLALFFVVWALLTGMFFVGTRYTNRALQALLLSLTITFILLAAGEYSPNSTIAAGALGIVVALLAIYIGFAELMNEMWNNSEAFPLWPTPNPNSETHFTAEIDTKVEERFSGDPLL